jgi:hypothetical protein
MSKLPLPKELTIPKAHKKHLKSIFENHPNAHQLCTQNRYEEAAALLREDGFLTAPNLLIQASRCIRA